ncbi:MAG: hypothetical protein AB8B62_04265 [Roseobacter sp.]
MSTFRKLCLALAMGSVCTSAQSADFSDPTWPCVQRKVESLSLGLMWPFPVDAAAITIDETQASDIHDLAGYLSLRRVDLDSLQIRVDDFAEKHEGDPELLGLVFEAVFTPLSKRRGRIISGIEDFSLGQIALAEKIDGNRAEMDAIMTTDAPDFDRVDVLEEQLDWDQVIYTDRQRNISYLCETPTLLERRLFAISQMLQGAIKDQS